MTIEQKSQTITMRTHVFNQAENLVGRIVEKHPLQTYKVGSSVFTHGDSTMTATEQYLDLLIRTADWLLEES